MRINFNRTSVDAQIFQIHAMSCLINKKKCSNIGQICISVPLRVHLHLFKRLRDHANILRSIYRTTSGKYQLAIEKKSEWYLFIKSGHKLTKRRLIARYRDCC